MIKDNYPLRDFKEKTIFLFVSHGKKGQILKGILFQKMDEVNNYNLAFGDVINKKLDDEIVSNNGDAKMVISTVVEAVYIFFKTYPEAILEIDPVDKKRTRFYNYIFKSRYKEIEIGFILKGYSNNQWEQYDIQKSYQKFEIAFKKN